ncbi:hypothetical protein C5C18_11680 [Rathayibacter tritici]|uniref:Uncharacterized protein n=1 Tax=Rathayibacter tritici TaxID=33888 RepID=A0A160KUE2_9MICO|nr:hypothetical protein [Rathayibacter tritici]AND17506.1 hypothetical protein A6122_2390 [Rathayibacter tritici]PPF23794.1 hypothetical protein C5C06_13740 [Rathayibacter tritici]PPF62340.1 hypothetical protein C5C21_14290 [Rathayibacter tritici]PPG06068.1 hypothetical protein C5C18_11680 [Rathayibacter tritici]PPI19882.1 hypothetical protein C5D07_00640 [Rathayibacter tritici]
MGIAEPFDLDDHRRHAPGTLREHFSVREFEEVPLDREAIVATAYLHAIEHAALARVLPIARAHPDAQVRSFATVWAAERHRIADALGDVLAASPQIRGIDVRPPEPTVESRPLVNRVAAALPGPIALALAVDARIAMHSYRRLARLSLHPEMERLAEAIIGVLERQADFFTVHAAERLGRPLPRRVLAAGLLAVLRLPIGEADLPEPLAREGRELVFGRDDGGLDGIDAGIVAAFALPCTAARRLVHPHRPVSIRAAHRLGRLASDTRFAVATLLEQVRE